MDIVSYLKLGLKEIGSKKFRKDKRAKETKARRTSLRNNLRDAKRNLGSMTPVQIPTQEVAKKVSKAEKLVTWKKEKTERLAREKALKAKSKPIFKVSSYIDSISVDTAMNTIKGKPIPELIKKVCQVYQFANPGHKFNFNAPANSAMKHKVEKSKQGTEIKSSIKKAHIPNVRANTRSQKQLFVSPVKELKSNKREHLKSSSSSSISGDSKSDKLVNTMKTERDGVIKNVINILKNVKPSKKKIKIDMEVNTNVNTNINSIDDNKITPKVTKTDSISNKNTKNVNKATPKIIKTDSKNWSEKKDAKVTIRKGKKSAKQTNTDKNTVSMEEENNLDDKKIEIMAKESKISSISRTTMESKSPAISPKQLIFPTTPENQGLPVTYVSPFVTMSRGKEKARNEYKQRSSRGGVSEKTPENTGAKAGSQYFRNLLDIEIARIEKLCNEWKGYELQENPIEEACDMIHVAIGQSTLLITKRMNQFRGLIETCELQNSDPLITCKDLHGFWDMLLCQAENLNKRFENLERLKQTNWEEVLPEVKAAKPVVTRKKPVAPRAAKKAVKATSSIKDAIKAARKKASDERINVGDTQILGASNRNSARKSIRNLHTPNADTKTQFMRQNTPLKTPIGRKSLLHSVLSEQANRRTTISPSVAMMRVAAVEKQLNLSEATPSKSILKQSTKSTQKKGKSVIFVEQTANDKLITPVNDENDLNLMNSGEEIEVRRSKRSRLSRSKLF